MRSLPVSLLIAVALGGCQPSGPAPAEREPRASEAAASPSATPQPTPSQPASVAITEVEELVGEYRVAGVDGRDINLPYGITARISDVAILVEADCVKLSWSYFFEGTSLVTEQLFPRDSCGRKLLPEEEAIVTAFNGATAVGRTPANGIEFAGENSWVVLFSQ
jgi:hypothetical protein